MKKYFLHESARHRQSGRISGCYLSKYKQLYGEKVYGPTVRKHYLTFGDELIKHQTARSYSELMGLAIYEIWNLGYYVYTCPSIDMVWMEFDASLRKLLIRYMNSNDIWNQLNA